MSDRSPSRVAVILGAALRYDEAQIMVTRGRRPRPEEEASFASPEDVILKKLVFYREGGSEKHLRDIAGVVKISGDTLDWGYLLRWADRLAVADIWQAVPERLGR